jgi:hypothetical protein
MEVKSLDILATVGVVLESGYEIFHLDMAGERVFQSNGEQASPEVSEAVLSNIRGQQEAMMPDIPYEQIYEVMNTEKNITEENNKHIFRRQ